MFLQQVPFKHINKFLEYYYRFFALTLNFDDKDLIYKPEKDCLNKTLQDFLFELSHVYTFLGSFLCDILSTFPF